MDDKMGDRRHSPVLRQDGPDLRSRQEDVPLIPNFSLSVILKQMSGATPCGCPQSGTY